jgi:hypothetical protein
VSLLKLRISQVVERAVFPVEAPKVEHSDRTYRRAARQLVHGTDTVIVDGALASRCTNGAYVTAEVWVQDNWVDEDGALTEEGRKFSFTRVQNLA